MFVFNLFENRSSFTWCMVWVILIWILTMKCSSYMRSVLLAWKLPGPPLDSILGNCLLLTRKDLIGDKFCTAYETYGPIVRLWGFMIPFFGVLEPSYVSVLLSSKKNVNKPFVYRFMENSLGSGLITSNGDKWMIHRKLIQPVFSIRLLENLIPTFAKSAKRLCDKLNDCEGDVNIVQLINEWVMDVLNAAVLGISGTDTEKPPSPFKERKFMLPDRFMKPWLLFDWIYRLSPSGIKETKRHSELNEFTMEIIRNRRAMRGNDENFKKTCLLDYLIEIAERNLNFTDEDIINETRTFMHAGQDTVATATAFCLYKITQNEHVIETCLKEINDVFDGTQRIPTMSDLRNLEYLEMCIKETLRLYPSVTYFSRTIDEDIQIGKYKFPAGTNFFIAPYITHRLPHIYPDPEKFIPTRFSRENSSERSPCAYLPFSAGPRNCIGYKYSILEMKVVLLEILRNFDLKPVPGKDKFTLISRISLRASGGIWINLKRKTKCTI